MIPLKLEEFRISRGERNLRSIYTAAIGLNYANKVPLRPVVYLVVYGMGVK